MDVPIGADIVLHYEPMGPTDEVLPALQDLGFSSQSPRKIVEMGHYRCCSCPPKCPHCKHSLNGSPSHTYFMRSELEPEVVCADCRGPVEILDRFPAEGNFVIINEHTNCFDVTQQDPGPNAAARIQIVDGRMKWPEPKSKPWPGPEAV